VTRELDSWNLLDDVGKITTLPGNAALPEVSGAISTLMAERVADQSVAALVCGVIVAKRGFALALVGEDWASCIAVAMHLSLRGWSIVTPRYSFVDRETHSVEPLSKLLYVPSRILPLLPLAYRRALEASPWYSVGNELGFYGVDPRRVNAEEVRPKKNATLRACLVVDSTSEDVNGAVRESVPARLKTFLPMSDIGIASASLIIGPIVTTTDAVECWAEARLAGL
jgi:hypothetical protein